MLLPLTAFDGGLAAVINQIRSLTKDTPVRVSKAEAGAHPCKFTPSPAHSVVMSEHSPLAVAGSGSAVRPFRLGCGRTSVESARAAHLQNDGKRIPKMYHCAVSSPRDFWAPFSMTVFVVHHITAYRYKNPIRPGLHQLMFRPRDSFDQRLLDCHLKISPEPAETRWIHDVFGNCVTLVDFATKTKSLKFESIIRLEHTPENAPDFRIEDYARLHPFSYAEEEYPDLSAYIRRHHPNDVRVGEWLAKFVTPASSRPTGQLLMTLNEAIAESFSYRRRSSHGTQTPDRTIETQRGTCRDFALLMMEAARSLGFAARFVTGYVYVPDRDGSARNRRWSDARMVPNLFAGIRVGRIRSYERNSWQSRPDTRWCRANAFTGNSSFRVVLG